MAGKKNVMATIKRAISPLRPRRPADEAAGPSATAEHTPLTKFVMDKLTGPSKELFALSFAVQMTVDKHALVFDLADCLPWIGIGRIDHAVRLLTRHFKEGQYKVETVFPPLGENFNKGGRRQKRHWISLDILEDLMMPRRKSGGTYPQNDIKIFSHHLVQRDGRQEKHHDSNQEGSLTQSTKS